MGKEFGGFWNSHGRARLKDATPSTLWPEGLNRQVQDLDMQTGGECSSAAGTTVPVPTDTPSAPGPPAR